MRSTIIALSVSLSSAAFASEANIYKCKGQGVGVRMTLSSFTGEPTLKVDALTAESENSPGGRLEKVKVSETAMGLEVTGDFIEIADATLSYTLIVPHIIVNEANPVMTGNAMLVRSMTGGFIPPSAELARVVESNKFTPLVCEASKVLY